VSRLADRAGRLLTACLFGGLFALGLGLLGLALRLAAQALS